MTRVTADRAAPPARGAGGVDRRLRVLLLVDHLGSGGAQAILADIATLADPTRYAFAVGYLFGRSMYTEPLRAAGVEVVHLGRGGGKHVAWLHALIPARLLRLARRFSPDVVHVHTHTLPVAHALLLRRWTRRRRPSRLVFTMHANLWQLGDRWSAYLRRCLPSFDRVVTEFHGSREEVARLAVPNDAVVHIPFGARVRPVAPGQVEAARAAAGAEAGDLLLVSVARLSPDRHLDRFIRAMPGVLRRHPQARLALVGDGTAEPELRALVAALRLEDRVRFLGRAEDPTPWYHAADLYLTVAVAQTCEVGIAGWQAMLCGTPVVAIEPEPARNPPSPPACTHLRKVWSMDRIERAIDEVLADGAARAALAASGRAYAAAHQSSEAMVRRYSELYDRLADRSAPPPR